MTRNEAITFFESLIPGNAISAEAIRMAIEGLKEQQAEIERMKGEGKSPTWKKGKAFCGNCGGCLENKEMFSSYHVSSIRFCKWCGTPVNWSNE